MNPLHAAAAQVPEMMCDVATWPLDRVLKDAEDAADIIASGADGLWRPLHEVPVEALIRAISCGLAILAHRHGGVTFAGAHWCTGHCQDPGDMAIDTTPAKQRGAFYTPRSLAEEVTDNTLEALVYEPGPLQTADRDTWRVKSSAAILALKIGDIAVGAGVFLLAACRYLTARLLDAWDAENRTTELDYGVPLEQVARWLVISHCLYGADIDPLSIELSRLACALLSPLRPVEPRLVCGDSLLGISSLREIMWMHRPDEGKKLHGDVPPIDADWILAADRDDLRILADLSIGAALCESRSERVHARRHLRAAELGRQVAAGDRAEAEAQAAEWLAVRRDSRPKPIHWPLEFPEVFPRRASLEEPA